MNHGPYAIIDPPPASVRWPEMRPPFRLQQLSDSWQIVDSEARLAFGPFADLRVVESWVVGLAALIRGARHPGPLSYRPPFKVTESAEVDARQGPGTGLPAFTIIDARGSFTAGLFPSRAIAGSWLGAYEEIARRASRSPAQQEAAA